MENEVQPCEVCGSVEAEYVIDPYILEIDGEEVFRWLCPECYESSIGDI